MSVPLNLLLHMTSYISAVILEVRLLQSNLVLQVRYTSTYYVLRTYLIVQSKHVPRNIPTAKIYTI